MTGIGGRPETHPGRWESFLQCSSLGIKLLLLFPDIKGHHCPEGPTQQQPSGALPFPAAHLVWPNPTSPLPQPQFHYFVGLFLEGGGGRESAPLPLLRRTVPDGVSIQSLGSSWTVLWRMSPRSIRLCPLNSLSIPLVDFGQKWVRCESSVCHLCQEVPLPSLINVLPSSPQCHPNATNCSAPAPVTCLLKLSTVDPSHDPPLPQQLALLSTSTAYSTGWLWVLPPAGPSLQPP